MPKYLAVDYLSEAQEKGRYSTHSFPELGSTVKWDPKEAKHHTLTWKGYSRGNDKFTVRRTNTAFGIRDTLYCQQPTSSTQKVYCNIAFQRDGVGHQNEDLMVHRSASEENPRSPDLFTDIVPSSNPSSPTLSQIDENDLILERKCENPWSLDGFNTSDLQLPYPNLYQDDQQVPRDRPCNITGNVQGGKYYSAQGALVGEILQVPSSDDDDDFMALKDVKNKVCQKETNCAQENWRKAVQSRKVFQEFDTFNMKPSKPIPKVRQKVAVKPVQSYKQEDENRPQKLLKTLRFGSSHQTHSNMDGSDNELTSGIHKCSDNLQNVSHDEEPASVIHKTLGTQPEKPIKDKTSGNAAVTTISEMNKDVASLNSDIIDLTVREDETARNPNSSPDTFMNGSSNQNVFDEEQIVYKAVGETGREDRSLSQQKDANEVVVDVDPVISKVDRKCGSDDPKQEKTSKQNQESKVETAEASVQTQEEDFDVDIQEPTNKEETEIDTGGDHRTKHVDISIQTDASTQHPHRRPPDQMKNDCGKTIPDLSNCNLDGNSVCSSSTELEKDYISHMPTAEKPENEFDSQTPHNHLVGEEINLFTSKDRKGSDIINSDVVEVPGEILQQKKVHHSLEDTENSVGTLKLELQERVIEKTDIEIIDSKVEEKISKTDKEPPANQGNQEYTNSNEVQLLKSKLASEPSVPTHKINSKNNDNSANPNNLSEFLFNKNDSENHLQTMKTDSVNDHTTDKHDSDLKTDKQRHDSEVETSLNTEENLKLDTAIGKVNKEMTDKEKLGGYSCGEKMNEIMKEKSFTLTQCSCESNAAVNIDSEPKQDKDVCTEKKSDINAVIVECDETIDGVLLNAQGCVEQITRPIDIVERIDVKEDALPRLSEPRKNQNTQDTCYGEESHTAHSPLVFLIKEKQDQSSIATCQTSENFVENEETEYVHKKQVTEDNSGLGIVERIDAKEVALAKHSEPSAEEMALGSQVTTIKESQPIECVQLVVDAGICNINSATDDHNFDLSVKNTCTKGGRHIHVDENTKIQFDGTYDSFNSCDQSTTNSSHAYQLRKESGMLQVRKNHNTYSGKVSHVAHNSPVVLTKEKQDQSSGNRCQTSEPSTENKEMTYTDKKQEQNTQSNNRLIIIQDLSEDSHQEEKANTTGSEYVISTMPAASIDDPESSQSHDDNRQNTKAEFDVNQDLIDVHTQKAEPCTDSMIFTGTSAFPLEQISQVDMRQKSEIVRNANDKTDTTDTEVNSADVPIMREEDQPVEDEKFILNEVSMEDQDKTSLLKIENRTKCVEKSLPSKMQLTEGEVMQMPRKKTEEQVNLSQDLHTSHGQNVLDSVVGIKQDDDDALKPTEPFKHKQNGVDEGSFPSDTDKKMTGSSVGNVSDVQGVSGVNTVEVVSELKTKNHIPDAKKTLQSAKVELTRDGRKKVGMSSVKPHRREIGVDSFGSFLMMRSGKMDKAKSSRGAGRERSNVHDACTDQSKPNSNIKTTTEFTATSKASKSAGPPENKTLHILNSKLQSPFVQDKERRSPKLQNKERENKIITSQEREKEQETRFKNPYVNKNKTKSPAISKICVQPKSSSEPSQQRQEVVKQSAKSPVTPTRESIRKPKFADIDVPMTGEYCNSLSAINKHAQPVLTLLRQEGLIPSTHTFHSLIPDVTRFIVKQYEKAVLDSNNEAREPVYQAVVLLHALVSASDVLVNCCLQSASAHLAAVQEKQQHIIKGQLDDLRQCFLKMQYKFDQNHVLHPKIVAMNKYISEWLYRKRLKKDPDPKILIICYRSLPSLFRCLKASLSTLENIQAVFLPASCVLAYQDITDSLENHNCLIVSSHQIREEFAWAQFSLVVEYEPTDQSTWRNLCSRQHIRYLALHVLPVNMDNAMVEQDSQSLTAPVQQQFSFIGSRTVTGITELLKLLETRYSITIIERDYCCVSHQNLAAPCSFADIIIDERTSIVIQDLPSLTEEATVEELMRKKTIMSLKFTKCYLMLYSANFKKIKNPYGYSSSTITNISKLYGAVECLNSKPEDFNLQVVLANSCSEMAQLIREIGQQAYETTTVWSKQDWLQRDWLSQDMSVHEKFLLLFPCMNAFSAQVLLTVAPLTKLFRMSEAQLVSQCPWLPIKVLKTFHQLCSRVPSPPPDQSISPIVEQPIETNNRGRPEATQHLQTIPFGRNKEGFHTQDSSGRSYLPNNNCYTSPVEVARDVSTNGQNSVGFHGYRDYNHQHSQSSDPRFRNMNIQQKQEFGFNSAYGQQGIHQGQVIHDGRSFEPAGSFEAAVAVSNSMFSQRLPPVKVHVKHDSTYLSPFESDQPPSCATVTTKSHYPVSGQQPRLPQPVQHRDNSFSPTDKAMHATVMTARAFQAAANRGGGSFLSTDLDSIAPVTGKEVLNSAFGYRPRPDTLTSHQTGTPHRVSIGLAQAFQRPSPSLRMQAGTQIHPRQAKYNVTDESPPMDLDSNESSPNLDNCSAEFQSDHEVPSSALSSEEELAMGIADKSMFSGLPVRGRVTLTAHTPKRPRLTYERVPGARGGQTRLQFC